MVMVASFMAFASGFISQSPRHSRRVGRSSNRVGSPTIKTTTTAAITATTAGELFVAPVRSAAATALSKSTEALGSAAGAASVLGGGAAAAAGSALSGALATSLRTCLQIALAALALKVFGALRLFLRRRQRADLPVLELDFGDAVSFFSREPSSNPSGGGNVGSTPSLFTFGLSHQRPTSQTKPNESTNSHEQPWLQI